MRENPNKSIAAIRDMLIYLEPEAREAGAGDLAFHLGLAIAAANDFLATGNSSALNRNSPSAE